MINQLCFSIRIDIWENDVAICGYRFKSVKFGIIYTLSQDFLFSFACITILVGKVYKFVIFICSVDDVNFVSTGLNAYKYIG